MRPESPVRRRITLARGQLVLNEPFFGALLLHLQLFEDPTCDTMWVDGVRLGYNPRYVGGLRDDELKGLLVHEVAHVALKHPWRRGDRDPDLWNEAADYAVNHIVTTARYVLPENALYEPAWAGLPAEAIYEKLRRNRPQETESLASDPPTEDKAPEREQAADDAADDNDAGDGGQEGEGGDGRSDTADSGADSGGEAGAQQDDAEQRKGGAGAGNAEPRTATNPAEQSAPRPKRRHVGEVRDAPREANPRKLEMDWNVAIVQAETVARSQGLLPAGVDIAVSQAKAPAVDWREALRAFVQSSVYSPDYSWRMPNRRYLASGLYLPGLQGETIPRLVIAVDTSGSIGPQELDAFRAEVQAVVEEVKPETTCVVFCDAQVQRVMELTPQSEFDFKPAGGGGTRFEPVFDWVAQQDATPACLVYLTDTYGTYPEQPPEYPVLWVSPPGLGEKPPFGTWIHMV